MISEELEEFSWTTINPSGVAWTMVDSSGVAGEYNDFKKRKKGCQEMPTLLG